MLQKTVPVSSVLHGIAANYKPWKTRSSGEKIVSTKKSKMIYNSFERSRYYSFSLVLCLVLPRFCARS